MPTHLHSRTAGEYSLEGTETYHYAQLIHWATIPQVRENATRTLTQFETFRTKTTSMRGTISALYKLLLTTADSPRPRYMHMWGKRLTMRHTRLRLAIPVD